MVNKEKDLLLIDDNRERSESEINNLDVEIKEKEEILGKLVFTVKEFGLMKTEYEKLLQEIG
jgi:hypothetical protein